MYNENTLRKLCLYINCMVQKVRMTDFVMINKFSGVNSNKMLLQNILIVLVLTACQGETLTWTNIVVYLLVFCYVFIIAILVFFFFLAINFLICSYSVPYTPQDNYSREMEFGNKCVNVGTEQDLSFCYSNKWLVEGNFNKWIPDFKPATVHCSFLWF